MASAFLVGEKTQTEERKADRISSVNQATIAELLILYLEGESPEVQKSQITRLRSQGEGGKV